MGDLQISGNETSSWLFSALAFAVSMSATPGPNNAMVASSGATFGFARTMPHILGVAVGFPIMIVAVALGAGDLMRGNPRVHEILRWIGAAYLIWLAFKIATARPSAVDAERAYVAGSRQGRTKPMNFLQAALFQWLNPKAWVVAVGGVATYTTANGVFAQAFVLAIIFLIVTLPSLAFWTFTGVGAARLLRSNRALRVFNLVMAVLLVASLLPLLGES